MSLALLVAEKTYPVKCNPHVLHAFLLLSYLAMILNASAIFTALLLSDALGSWTTHVSDHSYRSDHSFGVLDLFTSIWAVKCHRKQC